VSSASVLPLEETESHLCNHGEAKESPAKVGYCLVAQPY